MSDDLLIRVDAQTSQFEAAFGKATASTVQLEAALKRASAQQKLLEAQLATYGKGSAQALAAQSRAQMANARLAEQAAAIQAKAAAEQKAAYEAQTVAYQRMGRGLVIGGGAIALALGLSAKAAIDWEAAFAGVRKVLDGTPAEIAAVEQGLRDLATTIPTSAEELAAIAASAGALGIQTPNVVEFTEVIAKLGETTNLVGDEGATSLARFANVMGTAQDEIDNIASSLVDLGNNGASTESEIISLGLRIAAAGKQVGLTEGEVLGLANAALSLGLPVEAAGTAISQTFQLIDKSVASGGKSLEAFADIAGVSGAKFKKTFEQDAAGAFDLFLQGLRRVDAEGGNVYQTLNDLGITGQRQVATLTALSSAGGALADSLRMGNAAYEANNALALEFAERAKTTAAQMEVARNQIHDLAIDLGQVLLPAVGDVAGGFADLGNTFASTPGPVKELAVVLAAAAAGVGLFGGAALLASSKIRTLKTSFAEAQANGTAMSKGFYAARGGALALGTGLAVVNSQVDDSKESLKGLLSAASLAAIGFGVAGPWGAAVGGAIGLLQGFGGASTNAAGDIESLTASLDENTGAVTENSSQWAVNQLVEAGQLDNIAALGLDVGTVTQAMLGNAAAIEKVNAALAAAGPEFEATSASGKNVQVTVDELGKSAGSLGEFLGTANGALSDAQAEFWATKDAADAAGAATGEAATDVERFGRAADQTAGRIETLSDALKELQGLLDERAALRNYEEALDKANKLAKDNVDITKNNTQAQRDGQAAFDAIASAAVVVADKIKDVGEKHKYIQGVRDDLIDTAHNFGLTRAEAVDYVDQLDLIQPSKKTQLELLADKAIADAERLRLEIANINSKTITITFQRHGVTVPTVATGGYIRGPGTSTSDSIPAMLSDGEYVIKASAVKAIGVPRLHSLNARGYATGGPVGGGGDGRFDLADLLRLARPQALPGLRDINRLRADEAHQVALLKPLLRDQKQAREALKKVEQDENATAKERAAASREAEQAEKAVADQRDEVAKATDRMREAQGRLLDDVKARIEQVQSLGDAFGGEGTSLSAQGLLAKKRSVGSDAAEFNTDLRIIRRKGADRDLLEELRSQGSTQDALALLRDLVRQPRSYFRQLNRADDRLDRNARTLSAFGIGGAGGTRIGHQTNIHVDKIVARDEKRAVRELHREFEKGVAMARLRS